MSSSSSFPSSSSCCSFSWLFLIPGSEEIKITTGCSRRGSINGSQEQQQVGWLNTSDVQERERVKSSQSVRYSLWSDNVAFLLL
jgi:hypothetical protein